MKIGTHRIITQSVTGLPLKIFPDNWKLSTDMNIYQAIKLAFGDCWDIDEEKINFMVQQVDNNRLRENQMNYSLTDDEVIAIFFYTLDVLDNILDEKLSVFSLINTNLAKRKIPNNLLPFIDYLIKGLEKLPNYRGTVYRGIKNLKLTNDLKYQKDNKIVWVAFTSTTTKFQVMKDEFVPECGTRIILYVEEGKDISNFSRFPAESEILLLPNTQFCVIDPISADFENVVSIDKPEIVYISLKQETKPLEFKFKKPPTRPAPKIDTIWYLVINKVFTENHILVTSGTDYVMIKNLYDKQPVNFSSAIIYVGPDLVPNISNFYGNPLFKKGMKDLVQRKRNI